MLENAGGQGYGIWVSPKNSAGPTAQADDERPPCGSDGSRIQGFSVEGFTIRGFDRHGVHLACVDGFRIEDNVSEENRVYGLFPVVSQHGVLSGNTVRGSSEDAGIYVGQSDDVFAEGLAFAHELIATKAAPRRTKNARGLADKEASVAAIAAVSHGSATSPTPIACRSSPSTTRSTPRPRSATCRTS